MRKCSFIFPFSLVVILSMSSAEYRKLIPICSNSCLPHGKSTSTNCFCDSKCSLIYNDCCLDAPYRTFRMAIKRKHNIRCVFVHGENRHFWMVNNCKDSWTGHNHVREKCRDNSVVSSESSDLIGIVPVTDPKESVTYKNYYCSICNNANTEDLVEWRVKALCSSLEVTQAEILENLTFIEEKKQWGVWKWDTDHEWSFQECYLLFEKPSNITNGIRSCVSGMVSACPKSWGDMSTRRKCKSYVDPVKWNDGIVYRNMDCAMCHNRTTERYQCAYDIARGSNAVMLSRAMKVDLSCSGQWF